MSHPLEETFCEWSKRPSDTEKERCENAEGVVRNAIRSYTPLSTRNLEVFAQGSYRNGTNVKADSDVDICVRCMDVCFPDLSCGVAASDLKLVDAVYTYSQFKNDIEQALRDYLGSSAVTRGDKAFDLHANTYRVDADVVPAFEHRRYFKLNNGDFSYLSGTELHPDNGGRIVNWPHQNCDNGTAKNSDTRKRFKRLVRILKRLRNEMDSQGITAAKSIPSYFIECLVWNVPNAAFGSDGYAKDLRATLVHLYTGTKNDAACSEWGEVNELKYLFRTSQPWTRSQAHDFVVAAWNFADFK